MNYYNLSQYPVLVPAIRVRSVISSFDAVHSHPFVFTGEFHPFWEFVYVVRGCIHAAGDENCVALQQGDVIFHRPMEFHRLWTQGEDVEVFIASFIAQGEEINRLEGCVAHPEGATKEALEEYRLLLKDNFDNGNGWYADCLNEWAMQGEKTGVIQKTVNSLERFLLLTAQDTDSVSHRFDNLSQHQEAFLRMVDVLTKNLTGWVTPEEVTKAGGFSLSQGKRIFSAYAGTGIHSYFLGMKTAEAIRRLLEGETVSGVADALGFRDANYFSTVFRRQTGVSPREYVRRLENRE